MPHVDINVNTDVVKSAEIAKTMTDVVTVVAGHFETNAEYVAAGVASQGDHVLHRKDIEIVVSAASGANKVREAAGPALAKALLDYYVGWSRELGHTYTVNVSVRFFDPNPYWEGAAD